MWKNRLYYLLFTAVFAGFLFFFGSHYLAAVVAVLAALPVILWLFLLRDGGRITMEASIRSGSRQGERVPLLLRVGKKGRLWIAGSVLVELELGYTMYGIRERKKLLLPLNGRSFSYELPVDTACCGELCVRCRSVEILDLLQLFRVRAAKFREVGAIIYPRQLNLDLEFSGDGIGFLENDGLLQNRKGTDYSEIFDLRDYRPGDDVRAIHWKLSGKLDRLVVKEASDPARYQVVLMPDLGREETDVETGVKRLNTAVALCAALGFRLIRRGVAFYMAVPVQTGLVFKEVRSVQEFPEVFSEWLSMELPENSGLGLRYFAMEHREQNFSKLLIVASGSYGQELGSLGSRIRTTVIRPADIDKAVRVSLNQSCDVMEIPIEWEERQTCRVLC